MPENPKQIKLAVTDLLDAICHGCCCNGEDRVENPKMCCMTRREGEYCQTAVRIGSIICKRTSLENQTYFEETCPSPR